MRFSRAKSAGSFRIFHPSSRRVAAHTATLGEARKDAAFWSKQTPNPIEIQERFPSGQWVTVETVVRKSSSATGSPRTAKKSAHATKAATKTGTGDKITIDQLAKMFGLPDWDKIDEMNQQHYWEMARGAEDEEAQMEAEQEAQGEVYRQWYDAVESAANKLFEEHGLELRGSPLRKGKDSGRPHTLKIFPSATWNTAADKIRETINGVGDFHFDSLREFLDSGPYTAKQAVLSHLGAIRSYPAVYGGQGARQMYDSAW